MQSLIKYKQVAGISSDMSDTLALPAGTYAVSRIRGNGQLGVRVVFAWDCGGQNEQIFAATEGDIDIQLDTSLVENQIVADGVAAVCIKISNINATQSGVVGGAIELVKI